jgi:hydroxymethylglutaryl-CoA lyase
MLRQIRFNEVVTRDGFQNEPRFVPTATKVALIDALSECGFSKIEVTSFASPSAVPMLRDAPEVMARIKRFAGVRYTALVPNARGAERALEARCDELNFVTSATEAHNSANLRMSREDSFAELRNILRHVGLGISINVSISCCFGCVFQGRVLPDEVFVWIARFAALGIREMTICDTVGIASPDQAASMARELKRQFSQLQFTFHFHDTRGMGLANVMASASEGINSFDGSLGGLGGCPYAPGATGNVCSEDTVHMLEAMGYNTGVDVERVATLARRLPTIVGHEVPGKIATVYKGHCAEGNVRAR